MKNIIVIINGSLIINMGKCRNNLNKFRVFFVIYLLLPSSYISPIQF